MSEKDSPTLAATCADEKAGRHGARPSRRRILSIIAGAGAAVLAPGVALGAGAEKGDKPPHRWRGRLLGAEAALILYHHDQEQAARAIAAVVAEVHRLERLFSLHNRNALLVRLNSGEEVARLPAAFVELLGLSERFHRLSEGRFDPTVAPLWDLHAAHFTAHPRDERGPDEEAIAAVRERIGLARLPHPRSGKPWRLPAGMKLVFNGIAQGYVTDRAVALLRRRGFRHALVNFGEYRALGTHPAARPFRLALADPSHPGAALGETVLPTDMALATSSPLAASFDEAGRFHHLIDPLSGRPAPDAPASLWVRAADATSADALSTALAVTPPAHRGRILARAAGARAWFATREGTIREIRRI